MSKLCPEVIHICEQNLDRCPCLDCPRIDHNYSMDASDPCPSTGVSTCPLYGCPKHEATVKEQDWPKAYNSMSDYKS